MGTLSTQESEKVLDLLLEVMTAQVSLVPNG
jgi:hypothetical protein